MEHGLIDDPACLFFFLSIVFRQKCTNETDGLVEHLHGFLRRENVTREWNFRRENATGNFFLLYDWDQPPNARNNCCPGRSLQFSSEGFPLQRDLTSISLSISCSCVLHLQLSSFCTAWWVVAQSHLINLENERVITIYTFVICW